MVSQGEAVYQAVVAVLGEVKGKVSLNDDQKKAVHAEVLAMFLDGRTSHKRNPGKDELVKYIPGLVNNWVRKDLRLNGGAKYVTQKPGSRTGSGDDSLKAMKALRSITTDPTARAAIDAEIAARVAALKPKIEIDATKLPESLRHLAPKGWDMIEGGTEE